MQRGIWSLADQWLFSGANFIANILLARWLQPEAFGAFALVFSVYLFSLTIHDALLSEPMLVLGNSKFKRSLKQYIDLLLRGHLLLSLAAGLLMNLIAWQAPLNEILRGGLNAAGLLLPALLLPWLLRRIVLLSAHSDWAAIFSLIYTLVLLPGIWFVWQQGALTVPRAFAVFGLASLVASLPFVYYYRKSITGSTEVLQAKEVLLVQWGYAKWALAATLPIWVPLNLFYFVLPVYGGLEAAAGFKALTNLVMPFEQSALAVSLLLLPQLSGLSRGQLLQKIRKYAIKFLVAAILYSLGLYLFRTGILAFIYNDLYSELANLLSLAGLLIITMGLSRILVTGLRAAEQSKSVFWSYLVGALLAATIGIWLSLGHSIAGALAGQTFAYMGMAIVLYWQLFKSK